MILRLWRGWTSTPSTTTAYQNLLAGEIAPRILDRNLPGLHDLTVWRRPDAEIAESGTAEFLTSVTFEDWQAIADFTGGDPHRSVVPPAAQQLPTRFDEHSRHYAQLARFTAQHEL